MSHPVPGHEYGENEHDEHSAGPRGKALKKKINKKKGRFDALINPNKAHPNSPLGKLNRLVR